MKIRKVGEGAYFVPSYSEQTIVTVGPNRTTLGLSYEDSEEEFSPLEVEEGELPEDDFHRALRKVSRKITKQP